MDHPRNLNLWFKKWDLPGKNKIKNYMCMYIVLADDHGKKMTFYLTPPNGNITLQKLTLFAETRLKFLCQVFLTHGDRMKLHDLVLTGSTVEDSECLIEGSLKDRISHFILRLAFAENKEMRNFLIGAETLLFDFRFSSMSKDELYKCFRSLDTHLRHFESLKEDLKQVLKIFADVKIQFYSWKRLINKYLIGEVEHYLQVPFQTVYQLVAKREVLLSRGIASIPVCKLRELATNLFSELLKIGVQEAASVTKVSKEDERMFKLFQNLRSIYYQRCGRHRQSLSVPWSLTHDDIDKYVSCFPPCMSQLHTTLRQQHRLNHHARIQYTLFLKEAGLPVHEALMFWRKEYSQPSNNHNGCGHNWSEQENRYTYNIRHLYGLEGSRINYRAHSCTSLQEMHVGANCEGGCPFSHFDANHLYSLMKVEGICDRQLEIIDFVAQRRFSEACEIYFREKLKALTRHATRPKSKSTDRNNRFSESEFCCFEVSHTDQEELLGCQNFNQSASPVDLDEMVKGSSLHSEVACKNISVKYMCNKEPVMFSSQSAQETNTSVSGDKASECYASSVKHTKASKRERKCSTQYRDRDRIETNMEFTSSDGNETVLPNKLQTDDIIDKIVTSSECTEVDKIVTSSEIVEIDKIVTSSECIEVDKIVTSSECVEHMETSATYLDIRNKDSKMNQIICVDNERNESRKEIDDFKAAENIVKPIDFYIQFKNVARNLKEGMR